QRDDQRPRCECAGFWQERAGTAALSDEGEADAGKQDEGRQGVTGHPRPKLHDAAMPTVMTIATDSTCPAVARRPARLRSVIIVAALAAGGELPPRRTAPT